MQEVELLVNVLKFDRSLALGKHQIALCTRSKQNVTSGYRSWFIHSKKHARKSLVESTL